MRSANRKVADLTVDELKTIIHEVVAEDLDAWKETLEILSDPVLMGQIKRADADWKTGRKGAYKSWEAIKRV